MNTLLVTPCLLLTLLTLEWLGSLEAQKVEPSMTVRPLELLAAPGSGQPNLCVGPDNTVYVSWIEPAGEKRHALRFASCTPGAHVWSAPRTIAEGEHWFVNWADVPSLVVSKNGSLVAHWLVRSGKDPYAYSVYISHSTNGGRTWSHPRVLHDDGTPTEHGFVSLLPLEKAGTTLAVWLDGRKSAGQTSQMTLRSRILRADGSWGREMLVDGLVCDCCQTSAVSLPGGKALVVYRDRSKDEIRDISAAHFDGRGWRKPAPVHADEWHIPGCPVNGPAVDARSHQVVVAWFTAAQDRARVQVAFSADGGRTFSEPVRVDQGQPIGRVDTVMMDDGSALVSWVEATGKGNEAALLIRRVAPQGAQSEPIRIEGTTTSRASGFPRLARAGAEIIFAWTQTGDPSHVRTTVAKMR